MVHTLAGSADLTGWEVLDAGCGEGRNAAFLARAGARVLALDMSRDALAHAAQAWDGALAVTWQLADVRAVPLPCRRYALVVATGLLHWLADAAEVAAVVGRLRTATAPGGFHVISAFNDRHQELDAHDAPPRCILPHQDYLELYAGWRLLACRDKTSISSHPGVPVAHTHSVTKILAQQPRETDERESA
jgi:2-polyprenyl-3-methyl-5-hydroxy-6-metoxy-1,4-benzoquinol methylase